MYVNVEYIVVGLMIILILMVVQTNILNVTTHILAGFEQSASYQKVAKILDVFLLSSGEPADWWDYTKYPDPKNISSFGLALDGEEEYVLDIRKLWRLDPSSGGYVSPTLVRSLLGLRSYYDFSLKITPVFTVTITNTSGDYNIHVSDTTGVGLPNANVTAFYIPSSLQTGVDYNYTSQKTSIDGSCSISFDYNASHGIVLCVNHLGVTTLASKPENLNLRIVGNHVFETQYPLVSSLECETASYTASTHTGIVYRYVTIDGVYFYVEYSMWE